MRFNSDVSAMELIMQLEEKVRRARKEVIEWQVRCIAVATAKVGPWVIIGIGIGMLFTSTAWYVASKGHVFVCK